MRISNMSEITSLSLEEREAALLKREAELDAREAALVEREAAVTQSVSEEKVEEVESGEPPAGKLSYESHQSRQNSAITNTFLDSLE